MASSCFPPALKRPCNFLRKSFPQAAPQIALRKGSAQGATAKVIPELMSTSKQRVLMRRSFFIHDSVSVSHAMPAPETLRFFGGLSALPKVSLPAANACPEASTKKVVGDFSPPTARSGLKSPTTLPGPPGLGSSHSSRGNRHFQTGEHAGGGASRDGDGDRVRACAIFRNAHARA